MSCLKIRLPWFWLNTDAAAVSLMTGVDAEELDDLGGLPK
jgi:hypothetical protein